MDYILTTSELTKAFGPKKAANKVSLHVKRGEVYGLIGRNGAGKTTVLKMIAGLSAPTSGSFTFNSKNEAVGGVSRIGALIENPGLYPKLTAFENLKLKCLAMGKNDDAYVKDLLELVGLAEVGKKTARNFSLGMKQRLGIALALAGDPEFIVLDEPINGLDPQGIVEVREIISHLSRERGITVIVSSHILEELHKVADSFGIIHSGRLVDEFSAEELSERLGTYTVIKASDMKALESALSELSIEAKIESDGAYIDAPIEKPAALLRLLVEKNIGVYEFVRRQSTLEDYYLRKTSGEVAVEEPEAKEENADA